MARAARGTDFDRQCYRLTLMGDALVGVDGSPSIAIEGNPIEAA
jgi:taurine dioxygenase